MKMKKLISIVYISIISCSQLCAQCAMCAASVNSNDENKIGHGLNYGIVFLMSAPYILVGTVAFIWYKKRKKVNQN